MVHCICTCDIQLRHFVLVSYRPVDRELAKNFLVDPRRRQVGDPCHIPYLFFRTLEYFKPAMSNQNALLVQKFCHYLHEGRTLNDVLSF